MAIDGSISEREPRSRSLPLQRRLRLGRAPRASPRSARRSDSHLARAAHGQLRTSDGLPAPRGQVIQLPDGRALGYAEFGDPAGTPIFFFHGWGGSRLARHPDDSIAASLGVRVIAVDRPGIGLSDRKPRSTLLDWPEDVAVLADALELPRFGVLGWSGGGAFAVACAYRLGERVTALGVVSGPGPLVGADATVYLRPSWRRVARMTRVVPWVMRAALWQWGRPVRRDPARHVETAVASMVDSDRELMADPRLRMILIQNAAEVYRQGGRGMYEEGLLLARPWGFRPEDVSVPVHLWHGEADLTVPAEMGRHLAKLIPGCRAHFYPDEGHHLLYRRWAEILSALTA
ncbi:alpha/beta hydrolase [soil metagenome]